MGIKFLVLDGSGIFTEQANGLAARGKNQVKFWTQFTYKYADYAKGNEYGFLEKVLYYAEHIEESDCICNFDVRLQDLIGFLREKYPNKSIFGSGYAGSLEDDRIMLKEFVKSFGLPIQNYAVVHGVSELREYLKKHKNVYVKVNLWRDDMESFFSTNYEIVESEIDHIANGFGPHAETYDFVVEDAIDTDVEIGVDLFFNGKDYCRPYLIGFEMSKNGYIGKVVDELPPALEETMSAFRPLLEKLEYRGAISTEEKIISQKKHYLIDLCARMASPFTSLYTEKIENWPDVVYKVGKGETVSPKFTDKYVGAFSLKSKKSNDMYIKVNIKDDTKVKMFMPMGSEKGDFAVQGEDHVAVVIAGGDSPEEVVEQLKENSKLVEANSLDTEAINGLDKIFDIIKEGEKVGILF